MNRQALIYYTLIVVEMVVIMVVIGMVTKEVPADCRQANICLSLVVGNATRVKEDVVAR